MPDKTQLILQALQHTVGKDCENYVVTGIWHRLIAKGVELQPITQQYVRRDNGYALLDLYFPAVNIAIECDEAQHFTQRSDQHTDNDMKREHEVLRELGALEVTPDLIRIDARKTYQEINKALDNAVEQICRKYEELGRPEWIIRNPVSVLQTQGKIRLEDNLLFEHTADVLNGLGARTGQGTEYEQWSKGGLTINDGRYVSFQHITTVWRESARWNNVMPDPEHLIEYYTENNTPTAHWQKRAQKLDNHRPDQCLVFGLIVDALGNRGYKYFGTFEMESYDFSASPLKIVWRRIATEAHTIAR